MIVTVLDMAGNKRRSTYQNQGSLPGKDVYDKPTLFPPTTGFFFFF